MKYTLLILIILNFASYLWSVIGVFKKHEERFNIEYRMLQLASVLVWAFGLRAILLLQEIDWAVFISLAVIQMLCLTAFWMNSNIVRQNEFSIVLSKDIPAKLVQQGLFRWVRHPFYTIYLACYFSIGVFLQDPATLLLSTCLAIMYYRAASYEEKKFASSPLATEYQEYCKRAYMFFPKFFKR